MKACIIQPPYSVDQSRLEEYFQWELDAMDKCDESMDLIVLPESCDVPCYVPDKEGCFAVAKRFGPVLQEKAAQTAKRCDAILFCNMHRPCEGGLRNSTLAFDRSGQLVGWYDKQHLTPGEVSDYQLDSDYTFEYSAPTVLEIDGLRYGFLTCYDFYFYENFANLARNDLDIIIGCSHQRTDTLETLEMIDRFCAYNINAYLVRASVSLGEDSPVGGGSMIVAPDGKVLANLKSQAGMAVATFDPHKKHFKPAGFGGRTMAHHEYIERGRRPWKYRPAGSAIVKHDELAPYPRVCAHRGFNTVAPENSLPAFGAAVALGAEEIEFDLWPTKDGEIVSIHDDNLERVSTGSGLVYEHTYDELMQYDFGVKTGEAYRGLKILKFEEILKKFSSHVIMNIHVKTLDNEVEFDDALLQKIVDLIRKYDCVKYSYFMTSNDRLLDKMRSVAPDIARCAGSHMEEDFGTFVERALRYDCKKIQLFKPYFDQDLIDRAHANGIVCNVFWSDDEQEARQMIRMGIDTILTNDYQRISLAVRDEAQKTRSQG